jgi:rhodanese-related sulfurtransferase
LDAKKQVVKVVAEALIVAVAGAVVAFVANAVSPHGLTLSRNYFPGAATPRTASVPPPEHPGTNQPSAFELLAKHFAEKGLHLANSNEVVQLFHDPRKEQNKVVFIDARKDDEYQHGHIPGAWRYDYVHHEEFLPAVAPICLGADQIVIYCGGGNCELSEFAAIDLRDILSLPKEKLLVYGGGYTEWTNNRLPVEIGERGSGNVSPPK